MWWKRKHTSPEDAKVLSDFENNNSSSQQDPEKFLSVQFPLSRIKAHHNNITIPQSKEIIPPDTLKQRFNIVEDWFATNWNCVCSQLPKYPYQRWS